MPRHTIKIECEVKAIPAGEWRREEIAHGASIGEEIAIGIAIAIAIDRARTRARTRTRDLR